VAEDHPQVRRFIEMFLVDVGYRVTTAETGDQARALLEAGLSADLLLSDIRMPGSMDGLQLARWAQEHRPAMAIILQTGFAELKSCEYLVLQKPYPAEELLAAIELKLRPVR
jgi:DNA-binding NtrC family response regulator